MIVNHYKMRSDCKTFNFGGMGCSAGLAAVELAQNLLRHAKRGTKVVIFSHENITLNWYLGTNKGMLIPNLLFRVNGAAMFMTNEYNFLHRPKYQLKQTVRIYENSAAAHQAVYQEEDADGKVGVRLSKDLVDHVTKGLMRNFYYVGLKNLPLAEIIKFSADFVMKKLSSAYKKSHGQYTPNFSSVFKHYCIHCGGRAIIDGLQKNLSLSEEECEPSRAALYRLGNTSSASLWYEMNYIEMAGKQKAGDKVLQVTFGSGLKVNSAVWETL
jgi:3-ketoacyl-CoA synthase